MGRQAFFDLSVLMFYFATNSYVITMRVRAPDEVVTVDNQYIKNETSIEGNSSTTVVEKTGTICGTTDEEYTFFDATKSCYKFHANRVTWDAAEVTCVREGGHLAVINSQDEADFLLNTYSKLYEIYLGFHWKKGSWRTIQGQTFTEVGYKNWCGRFNDLPDYGVDYACVTLYYTGSFSIRPCDYNITFVCEKYPNSEPLPTFTTEVQTKSNTTPTNSNTLPTKGHKYYESTNTCYKFHTEPMTWDDAEATCVREGRHLAVINSQGEADFLKKYLSDPIWSGQTLTEPGYQNWKQGGPIDLQRKNCSSMNRNGMFISFNCDGTLRFICQDKDPKSDHVAAVTEPTNYTYAETDYESSDDVQQTSDDEESPGIEDLAESTFSEDNSECSTMDTEYTFFESTQSCYKVHTDRATWDDAEATCVREGGHLAVINSQDEAEILSSLYPEGAMHVFVGFSYREQDSEKLGDTDNQTLSEAGYENSTPGEPNNAGGMEYCGTLYGNGKFDYSPCYQKFQYICEINPSFF